MTIPTDGRIDLDALAPCPFCGEPPLVAGSTIWCANGACWGPHMEQYANLDEAIAAWNRRAAIPSEQGEAVAWDCADDAGIFCTTHVKTAAENIAAKGYTVTPLYHHPAPAAGVKVKALRWLDVGTPTELDLIAHTPFDTFHISRDDACEWPIILRPFITGQSNYQTVEEAKAAAQTDYETRILSALDQGEPK